MKSYSLFWFLIFLVFTAVSCKTVPLASVARDTEFRQYLFKHSSEYSSEYFSSEQLDIKIITDDTKNLRGKISIKQGEFIYANVNILGFELGRLELSVDSVKIINRLDKSFYFGAIDELKSLFGVDLGYEEIESIVLKGFVIDGSENRRSFRDRVFEGPELLSYTYRTSFGAEVSSVFNIETYRISKINIVDSAAGLFVSAFPGSFYEGLNYPKELRISVKSRGLDAEVLVGIGKISKDKFARKSFNVNAGYSEITF